ncbi:methenyltetrahydrofolate synthase domain-containing protein isoform X6 [Amblyraja radiata]|uniref:methenyltetrahydrofolate synthase domain-containing protein isoform X6 n=1 Tax=Amblyraja radiata TaxID=386614 RepID=UPI001403E8C6|nr:methenyltetrahydrofolate synthase domain-containing protein isoform X6 [Amblyraja radiata]
MEPAIKLQPGTNSRGSELEQRVTKGDIRQKIWDYMEKNNLANFPRPVHHRIPNFKGAYDACNKIRNLDCYIKAREVKVDPDKPLEGVRLAALQGVKDFSVPVQLDAKVHIDLVVVGSVAVSKNGWRIGKGEGFADLEYAMMVSMGSIDEKTVVVTTVHDCQLLDIPEELMDNHDLNVDYILTPTQVITTDCKRSKPQGIIWSKVDLEMMQKIPILKTFYCREKQEGKDIALKDERCIDEKELQKFSGERMPRKSANATRLKSDPFEKTGSCDKCEEETECETKAQSNATSRVTAVYMGNIPPSLRVSELKNILRDHNVAPLRLNWQGAQHRAFLDYKDEITAEAAVTSLAGLSVSGSIIRVELAKHQGDNRFRSQTNARVNRQSLT